MCEITSKVQCQDCLLFWEIGIVYCIFGKCFQPSPKNRRLNKDRYDIFSISNYVIRRGRLMELDTDQLRGNQFITKPTIHSGRQIERVTCNCHEFFFFIILVATIRLLVDSMELGHFIMKRATEFCLVPDVRIVIHHSHSMHSHGSRVKLKMKQCAFPKTAHTSRTMSYITPEIH